MLILRFIFLLGGFRMDPIEILNGIGIVDPELLNAAGPDAATDHTMGTPPCQLAQSWSKCRLLHNQY